MNATTTRRALLGAMPTAALMLTAGTAAVARSTPPTGHEWADLVADFHAKRRAWLKALEIEDQKLGAFYDAKATLPPKPQEPGSGLPDDITNMTIAEITTSGKTPEHEAAWAAYQRDLAAWEKQSDALEQEIVGLAESHQKVAYTGFADARDALIAYRVQTIVELRKKIEIIATDYEGCDIPEECFGAILADAAHLCGEVQA